MLSACVKETVKSSTTRLVEATMWRLKYTITIYNTQKRIDLSLTHIKTCIRTLLRVLTIIYSYSFVLLLKYNITRLLLLLHHSFVFVFLSIPPPFTSFFFVSFLSLLIRRQIIVVPSSCSYLHLTQHYLSALFFCSSYLTLYFLFFFPPYLLSPLSPLLLPISLSLQ